MSYRAHPLVLSAIALLAAVSTIALPRSTSAATDPAVGAAAQALVSSLNAGDVPALRRICAPSAVVIDEFAPYTWTGTDACARWYAAFGTFAKGLGVTAFKAVSAKPLVTETSGTRAYTVLAIEFRITAHGKPMAESGDWTIVMTKTAGRWRATSLAWATRNPVHPLAPSSAPAPEASPTS